ncbi:MAG TPA: hypothetical protein VII66_08730 [Gemmatimonadaceae bacterium]
MVTGYLTALHALANALDPWQSLFSNSKVISDAVTFIHLGGLLFAGGFAIAADRATFRAMRGSSDDRIALLKEVGDIHRPVLIGLSVLFVSGILLATSDVETFGKSPVFLVKMTLVALLLVNGLALQRTESALRERTTSLSGPATADPLWQKLRRTAIASIALWTSILLAGTILANS